MSSTLPDYSVVRPVNQWPDPAAKRPRLTEVVLSPGEDAAFAFANFDVVNLVPRATYHWTSLALRKPKTLIGNGATVFLRGVGPLLQCVGNPALSSQWIIKDVTFVGSALHLDRATPFGFDIIEQNCFMFDNCVKVSVINCNFYRFPGTALWFVNSGAPVGHYWDPQHIVANCRFQECRMGVSIGGGADHGTVSGCNFFDCQICFNVSGGQWNMSGNVIVNCRCAYLHTKGNWYQGTLGNINPAQGNFCDNVISNCDYNGNLWATEFMLSTGVVINLAGYYFDDDAALPPNWSGNAMTFCDAQLKNFLTGNNEVYCITGCFINGDTVDGEAKGKFEASDAVKDNIHLIGCSSNGKVTLTKIPAGNVSPSFGTIN